MGKPINVLTQFPHTIFESEFIQLSKPASCHTPRANQQLSVRTHEDRYRPESGDQQLHFPSNQAVHHSSIESKPVSEPLWFPGMMLLKSSCEPVTKPS